VEAANGLKASDEGFLIRRRDPKARSEDFSSGWLRMAGSLVNWEAENVVGLEATILGACERVGEWERNDCLDRHTLKREKNFENKKKQFAVFDTPASIRASTAKGPFTKSLGSLQRPVSAGLYYRQPLRIIGRHISCGRRWVNCLHIRRRSR
jgi:hypothetical protein